MPRLEAALRRGADYPALVRDHYLFAEQHMEAAALEATDRAAKEGLRDLRGAMMAARLGRLGFALGATSDLQKGRGVHRRGNRWSASGAIFVRSRSERTRGTIEAYTEGAVIRPRRGRFMWFPSDNIMRIVGTKNGRMRLTPEIWLEEGLNQKIGELVPIEGPDGPLLAIEVTGVNAVSGRVNRRGLTKRGAPRKGDRRAELVVAFIGIPGTSRERRVNVEQIVGWAQDDLPQLFEQALARRVRT